MFRLPMCCLGVLVLALVLGLAMPALATEAKGKMKSVDVDKRELIITDNAAKDWTFHLNKDGKVFVNEKESTLSALQAGDEAVVTYEKDGEKFLASEIRCTRK